ALMAQALEKTYNERLFSGGVVGGHHNSRFVWLRKQYQKLSAARVSVLEIGCYDGRAIHFIPKEITRYDGFDAGFETNDGSSGQATGIHAARKQYEGDARFHFHLSTDPADVERLDGEFDTAVSLETFEHIPPELVDGYILALAKKVRGPVFISVPSEKGIPLLVKTVGAALLGRERNLHYRKGELWNSLLGRMSKVERLEHKGFDYAVLMENFRRHFKSVRCTGVRCCVPTSLQVTVGFVARNDE
ncbi:MAG TPA: methyltransferase domain-containing protein, partial [Planctomycetota bacterium]|nr:methyltransferase domain-containing protein [Planctomycetota bacterium]